MLLNYVGIKQEAIFKQYENPSVLNSVYHSSGGKEHFLAERVYNLVEIPNVIYSSNALKLECF